MEIAAIPLHARPLPPDVDEIDSLHGAELASERSAHVASRRLVSGVIAVRHRHSLEQAHTFPIPMSPYDDRQYRNDAARLKC